MTRARFQKKLWLAIFFSWLFLSPYSFAEDVNSEDPYEHFNRNAFRFNERIDKLIFKPLATIYNAVLPKPVIKGVSNFFCNLDMIPTVINDLLQCNWYQATSDGWRFAVNSTIGVAGLVDVASEIGLEPHSEDFGLTLAHWGCEKSYYLVLPLFGPTTFRDATAFAVDYECMTVYPWIHPLWARYAVYTTGIVSRRAELLRFQSVMDQASLDKYVFMRDAYLQRRAYLIQRNKELGDPYFCDKAPTDTTTKST